MVEDVAITRTTLNASISIIGNLTSLPKTDALQWWLERVSAQSRPVGIYVKGGDASAGTALPLHLYRSGIVVYNAEAGILDHGFLGSAWIGCTCQYFFGVVKSEANRGGRSRAMAHRRHRFLSTAWRSATKSYALRP